MFLKLDIITKISAVADVGFIRRPPEQLLMDFDGFQICCRRTHPEYPAIRVLYYGPSFLRNSKLKFRAYFLHL